MKKISLFFLLAFIMISCSSDESTSVEVEEEENIPIETRKFVSKIYYDSSFDGLDEISHNYDSDNNLASIIKELETVTFTYEGEKIVRAEINDNTTGETENYINYFYRPKK